MIYSIADKTKYYRQNNNEIKPGIRCKPTATVEGLDLAGWPLPDGPRKQTRGRSNGIHREALRPRCPGGLRLFGGGSKSLYLNAGESLGFGVCTEGNTNGNVTSARCAVTLIGR